MMKFFFTKAGAIEDAKFVKRVGKKTFSYVGDEEEGVFFEEFVYQATVKCMPELANEVFIVLTEIKDSILALSFFNDKTAIYEGEETVFYDLQSIGKQEATGFLREFVAELVKSENGSMYVESLKKYGLISVVIDEKNEKVSIAAKEKRCDFNLDDIVPEELISKAKKIKRIVANTVPTVALLLLIAGANVAYYKYYLHGERLQQKMKKIAVLEKQIEKKQRKLNKLIKEEMKYMSDVKSIQRAKDLKNEPPEAIIASLEGLQIHGAKLPVHTLAAKAIQMMSEQQKEEAKRGKKNAKHDKAAVTK